MMLPHSQATPCPLTKKPELDVVKRLGVIFCLANGHVHRHASLQGTAGKASPQTQGILQASREGGGCANKPCVVPEVEMACSSLLKE